MINRQSTHTSQIYRGTSSIDEDSPMSNEQNELEQSISLFGHSTQFI